MRDVRTYTLSSVSWPRSIWVRSGEEHMHDQLYIQVPKSAEVIVEWWNLETSAPPAAAVRAFYDGWPGLRQVLAILDKMPQVNPQPRDVISRLEAQGFKPSEHHGQEQRASRSADRRTFERLRRERPEWFSRGGDD